MIQTFVCTAGTLSELRYEVRLEGKLRYSLLRETVAIMVREMEGHVAVKNEVL
jgi:hypothetical protein